MTNSNGTSQFLLSEYKELRGEILKRTELQHQLMSIALVALAALTSVGLKDSPIALLAYPMLALFLSAAWSYHDIQIAQLGRYIRYRIEDQLIGKGLGWENALRVDTTSKRIGARARLSARGILLGSQFLSVVLYLLKRTSLGWPVQYKELVGESVILLLGIVAIPLTMNIMGRQDELVKRIDESMKKFPVVEATADLPKQ